MGFWVAIDSEATIRNLDVFDGKRLWFVRQCQSYIGSFDGQAIDFCVARADVNAIAATVLDRCFLNHAAFACFDLNSEIFAIGKSTHRRARLVQPL